MAEIKDRILSLRLEKNLTQEQMAENFKIAKSTISMWEKGERTPRPATIQELCDYFNVDMDYLMGRSDIKNRYQAGLKYDWEKKEEPKESDPIVEEYQLNEYEMAEYQKILNMNVLMFNDKELSDDSKAELEATLKKIFVDTLLKKRAEEQGE